MGQLGLNKWAFQPQNGTNWPNPSGVPVKTPASEHLPGRWDTRGNQAIRLVEDESMILSMTMTMLKLQGVQGDRDQQCQPLSPTRGVLPWAVDDPRLFIAPSKGFRQAEGDISTLLKPARVMVAGTDYQRVGAFRKKE